MSEHMSEHAADTEEMRITALLEAWADAVRRHDMPAILAHHEPDMVMFDLPPPLQCKGIEAYETAGTFSPPALRIFFEFFRPAFQGSPYSPGLIGHRLDPCKVIVVQPLVGERA